MGRTPRVYDGHLKEYADYAFVNGRDEYDEMYRRSLDEPEAFWSEQAGRYLTWLKPWDATIKGEFENGSVDWFSGGVLNASVNCLDRHMPALQNKVAYYWEGDDPGTDRVVTYLNLFMRVNKLAGALRSLGVKRDDRVIIYMPMIVELPIAMLACARIGAVHCVVFGGYSGEALAYRIGDCGATTVVTVDGAFRGGKLVPLKRNVDEALESCPHVENVIVCNRTGLKLDLTPPREVWLHDLEDNPHIPSYVEPEPMDAEDPLFIIYAAGSTGDPRGLVHTHGGYLLYAAMTTRLVFNLRDHETFWCTADIGWIAGHTYGVYGPLLNGLTSVLFEGIASYPTYGRFPEIIAKYRVDGFYTAPTAVRALARRGDDLIDRYDLSSLKILGTMGEGIDEKAWTWLFERIGKSRCPIVDTWWQTESGGCMITPLPGVGPIKPGSCSLPFFGVDPVILDTDTGEEASYADQEGVLCLRRPWPALARTVYGDHQHYLESYFLRVPGLYFTGDAAVRDGDGYFRITGRIDEIINVSGYRLSGPEIEAALIRHRAVREAAVVGFPHPITGQGIYAFVSLTEDVPPSDAVKNDLRNGVRKRIGPIAKIDIIQWVRALPKTRSGKVLRQVLQGIASGRFSDPSDAARMPAVDDPSIIEEIIRNRATLPDAT